MSDFPSLRYMTDESICEQQSGHEPVRATNGALHVRRMFTGEKRTFQLVFVVDAANRAALASHYSDNRDASFSFFWPDDRQTYTVSYSTAPQYAPMGPMMTRARVTLMER